jgi:hypothetical protein
MSVSLGLMNRSNTSVLYSALAFTAIVGSFFLPAFLLVANGQSPMDMMSNMMMGDNGDNKTGNGMMQMMGRNGMMMGGNMSNEPFKMGVMVMPMMCTSPNELLGAFSGMLGGNPTLNGTGNVDNATEQMSMDMMRQQMMMMGSGGGSDNGMGNMSEAHLQQMMEMAICFPSMNREMMKGMNGMDGMMSMG